MKKMLVELPEELIKVLKIQAVERETTAKALVADALRRYFGIKEGGESGKK